MIAKSTERPKVVFLVKDEALASAIIFNLTNSNRFLQVVISVY